MTTHEKILSLIKAIRLSHSLMVDIFSRGSCLNFYDILHNVCPNAELYYDGNHMVTKIDEYCYDITGEVNCEDYLPFELFHDGETARKLKHDMLNNIEYKIK